VTVGQDAVGTNERLGSVPDQARWHGVHAVMVTPFEADLSVDVEGLRSNVAFLAESAVDVVICLGSEGEFYALSDDERRLVAERTAEELRRRRPLVVGVSHPSGVQARALARHAATIGADAVLATPPYFGQPPLAEIQSHFSLIAEAGLPVFLYNTPSRVGYGLGPTEIAAIVDLPGVIGVKQAAPDIGELVEVLSILDGSGCLVIGGSENTIWPALTVGAVGNTATAASAIPGVFAKLWGLARNGQLTEGLHLYRLLAPLREAYARAGGQAPVVKRLMDHAGLSGGAPRPPARPADEPVDKLLESLVASLVAEGLWTP
jgi:dihydrodipicolinate synthase/N-acetylneuraminate lyase